MSDDVLICPNCRARVFGTWSSCKFCGTALRVTKIDAAVDPDRLSEAASGAPLPPPPDQEPSGPRSPWGGGSWSSWTGAETAPETVAGSSDAGGAGWDAPVAVPDGHGSPGWESPIGPVGTPPGAQPDGRLGPGNAGGVTADQTGTLVPVEGADPTWVPGPAPTVEGHAGSAGTDAGSFADAGSASYLDDLGPSGLEPVSWYTEPGSADAADETSSTAGGTDSWASGADTDSWGSGGSSWPAESDTSDHPGAGRDPGPQPGDGSGDGSGDGPGRGPVDAPPDDFERFDASAIFREPEPSGDDGFGSDIEPMAAPGELAVNWQPAAADAWDTPFEPAGKPKRQALLSRESRLLVAGILVVLLAVVAVSVVKGRRNQHPDAWAANVQQIAEWVSTDRGIGFKYPVAVTTLGSKDYDAAVAAAASPSDGKSRRTLAEQVAMWRALGAVQGAPQGRFDVIEAQQPGLGAFYDLRGKRLVLRSGTDIAMLRQGVAGALSVALDDQRVDLSSFRAASIDENPLFDIVLGNAALVRSDLRKADAAPSQGSGGKTNQTGASGSVMVPTPSRSKADPDTAFLDARPDLQVGLGASFVQTVRDVRGKNAANALVKSPPVASQQLLFPSKYFDGEGAIPVPVEPETPSDADELATGSLGAQAWYLLMAAHIDDVASIADAQTFAQTWSGDSFVAYRKKSNGQICVTDVIRAGSAAQVPTLLLGLERWSQSIPGDRVQVRGDGDVSVSVTACDPGQASKQNLQATITTAVTAAVTRVGLGAQYYAAGKKIPNGTAGPVFTPTEAICMGDKAVGMALLQSPEVLEQLAGRKLPVYRDLTLNAGPQCGSTMASMLFTGN